MSYITFNGNTELPKSIIKLFIPICKFFIFGNNVSFSVNEIEELIRQITTVSLYGSINTEQLTNMYKTINIFIERLDNGLTEKKISDLRMYSEIFKICSDNKCHIEHEFIY